MVFVGGKNNFRYKLYPEYKKHRKEKHPNIDILKKYVINELGWIESDGMEADDYIYSMSLKLKEENTILGVIDKDLLQIPGWKYLYNSTKDKVGEFKYVSEEEACYNLRMQLLIGDSSDGINFLKGFGVKKAEKVLFKGMSEIAFKKVLITKYKKEYSDKYKDIVKLSYKLLKLQNYEDSNE
jgi:5'-3' exonuclease